MCFFFHSFLSIHSLSVSPSIFLVFFSFLFGQSTFLHML